MLSIDKYAYENKLRQVHPMEKFILTVMSLLICLLVESLPLYAFVIFVMITILITKARIPVKALSKMLLIPLPFILISVFTISFNIVKTFGVLDYSVIFRGYYIGFTNDGLYQGVIILFRSFACICSMYALSLTTPMNDLVWVMRKLKVPDIFCEMFEMIYRFIFVLLETARSIRLSQRCRQGYDGYKRSFYSLGSLVCNLFIKAFQNYRMLYLSMESRGYDGEFHYVEESYTFSTRNQLMILNYAVIVCVLIFI